MRYLYSSTQIIDFDHSNCSTHHDPISHIETSELTPMCSYFLNQLENYLLMLKMWSSLWTQILACINSIMRLSKIRILECLRSSTRNLLSMRKYPSWCIKLQMERGRLKFPLYQLSYNAFKRETYNLILSKSSDSRLPLWH